MNKSALLAISIVVILLLAAGVWYFFFFDSSNSNNSNVNTNQSANANTNSLPVKKTESPILIFAIDPATGTTKGGETVTITGANFVEGAKVFFKDTQSDSVTFVDATTLTVVVPEGSEGVVHVKVQNPDNLSGILQQAYTYTAE